MFADLATSFHLLCWSAMNLAKSAGEPSGDTAPSLEIVAFISGVLSPSFIAVLSMVTMARLSV